MILLGSYDFDNALVATTVKIRKMGETHSQDVAMARGGDSEIEAGTRNGSRPNFPASPEPS